MSSHDKSSNTDQTSTPYLILSINAGSSSLKCALYTSTHASAHPSEIQQLAEAEVSGLSSPPASLKYIRGDQKTKGEKLNDSEKVTDPPSAFSYVLKKLLADEGLPQLKKKEDLKYTCHRIVHGGDYGHVQVIDKSTFDTLEDLSDLAPLHNFTGLHIVRTVHEDLPNCVNMAYFDSSFHASIPEEIRTYAIDPVLAKRNKLRKYGFHGISYAFIVRAVAEKLGKEVEETSLIALHLGSGASACAIKGGKSLDTSMGLTPAAGLPGGTRSGDIDPTLVFHYTHDAGKPSPSSTKEMHITTAEEILNKQSGFKALTGTTDFAKIASSDDPKCKLAYNLFIDRILNYIGAYYVKLGGKVDALVFAGGIGEKSSKLRADIIARCECLGFAVDGKTNDEPEDTSVFEITGSGAKHKTLIVQTDEQFEMARGCAAEAEAFKSRQ